MNLSQRNSKVAQSRWRKIHTKERNSIKKDEKAQILKSAICGFIAGDGTIESRTEKNKGIHYDLRLFADDKEMISAYTQAIQYIYNKKPSTTFRDNVYHLRLTSKVVVLDILMYGEHKTINWTIPKNLVCTEKRKIAWIKAFFSAEAYVGKNHIKVQTINSKGMKQLSEILCELGIEHSNYTYQPKKKNHNKVSIIHIRKYSARKKYLDKIGF